MEALFISLLNLSITAGWMIAAVIVLRLVLKKAPKAVMCVLWALVGFRLICPFSIESALSLIPNTETVPQDIVYNGSTVIETGIPVLNQTVNPVIPPSLAQNSATGTSPVQTMIFAATVVWLAGMAAMLVYCTVSYIRIHRTVRMAMRQEKNIWLCDDVKSPFILGVFRPRIYLQSDITGEQKEAVLAHETAHIRRLDYIWKPLGFMLLTVYWFNPLVWVAYCLLCRDIELACDEKVIRNMNTAGKKQYSETLLSCSEPRRMINACPLAFGEIGVKSRIKSVLNYKSPFSG